MFFCLFVDVPSNFMQLLPLFLSVYSTYMRLFHVRKNIDLLHTVYKSIRIPLSAEILACYWAEIPLIFIASARNILKHGMVEAESTE
jgi:hypothetical protein